MAINLGQTYSQAARLNDYAAQLKNILGKLIRDKDLLNTYWQSTELIYINQAISDIDKKLNRVAGMLEGLNSSIRSAAQDVHREEEEARIAAERAAREAAAREAAAREAAAREAAAREAEAREAAAKEKAALATKATPNKKTEDSIQNVINKVIGKLFG